MRADPGSGRPAVRTALRHLVSGPVHPRAALHGMLAAGLGERGRLALVVVSFWAIGLADPSVWSTVAELASDEEPYEAWYLAFAAAVLALVPSLLAVVAYLLIAGLTALLGRVGPGARPAFAAIRSAVAVAGWVTVVPAAVASVVLGLLLPRAMVEADPPSLYSSLGAVILVPYLAVCLNGLGLPPLRASVTAALASLGTYLLLSVLLRLVSDASA